MARMSVSAFHHHFKKVTTLRAWAQFAAPDGDRKRVVGATSKRRRPGSAAIARGRASSLATAGMKWC